MTADMLFYRLIIFPLAMEDIATYFNKNGREANLKKSWNKNMMFFGLTFPIITEDIVVFSTILSSVK